MKIVEIFSSIEGEGVRTGQLCTFIRTFGCNCRCIYCDSMYALEGSMCTEMSIQQILDKCSELQNKCITFTGGEPLIQKDAKELLQALISAGYYVNVETNGSIDISEFFVNNNGGSLFFTLDYKTPYSGEESKMYMDNFYKYAGVSDVVKFVCADLEDLNRMKQIVTNMKQYLSAMPHIFVSPVFGKIEPVELVEYTKKYNLQEVRVQVQLHKIIWDPNMIGV